MSPQNLDQLCINTIRTLSIDAIEKANSGHPGLPMGAAPMAHVLWSRHLKHNPKNPEWADRDRFVLSGGHGSMLVYSLLHLNGYPLSLDEIKNFRQWGSQTPGHPEAEYPGVEATTGPLGQGSANVVGMAMAERTLAGLFNRPGFEIVNHYTYGLVTDGDLMEGINAEAASLAGHLKLGKLIYLYDDNDVTLDGPADLAYSENVAKRFESYGWHVQRIEDGNNDLDGLDQAIKNAKAESGKPSLIVVKTTIGYGSPNKSGTSKIHGAPLGADEIKVTKENLGWPTQDPFHVPSEAQAHFLKSGEKGAGAEKEWNDLFAAYSKEHPELAKKWQQCQKGRLPEGWANELPTWQLSDKLATRQNSGQALNAIAKKVSWFLGGDADLACSTNTTIKDDADFDGQSGKGRNIHFGVREHAMGAIANGMLYHGGLRPFVATFFVFSDYMRPAVRMAAMNKLPAVYVWTHDSIGLGEDGPTHQPVEHLMSLRAMPNINVIRPCDGWETNEAWRAAMNTNDRPTGIVLTRQKLPTLDYKKLGGDPADLAKGAYVLSDSNDAKVTLVATGSEVHVALATQQELKNKGISAKVVSMPCWELFEQQSASYQNQVLGADTLRVSIEAGVTFGWQKWVGNGLMIGLDRFGSSAPCNINMEKLGFGPSEIAGKVAARLKQ